MDRPSLLACCGWIAMGLWLGGAGCVLAQSPLADPPAGWDPDYWKQAQAGAAAARAQGQALQAEAWCARWVPYAEGQTVLALRAWAEFQDARQARSGAQTRLRAERLARVLAERSRAAAPGSADLGFVPDRELQSYAQALRDADQGPLAHAIDDLAAAYRLGQAAHVRRSLLMRQGQDPRGEC